jgi:hypothetical protein
MEAGPLTEKDPGPAVLVAWQVTETEPFGATLMDE